MARRRLLLLSFFFDAFTLPSSVLFQKEDRLPLRRHGKGHVSMPRRRKTAEESENEEEEENESSGKIDDEGLGHVSGTVAGRPPMMR